MENFTLTADIKTQKPPQIAAALRNIADRLELCPEWDHFDWLVVYEDGDCTKPANGKARVVCHSE